MKALIVGLAAVVGGMLLGLSMNAQELVPVPEPMEETPGSAGAGVPVGAPLPPVPRAESWRYRQFEGRWWYWMPENRWMWYSNDGRWIDFEATGHSTANAAPSTRSRATVTPYWASCRPGVAVGVGPAGNVNVAVGRRIGVDVCGPHGCVRVGRIVIGW
jgi:hypothetical protein